MDREIFNALDEAGPSLTNWLSTHSISEQSPLGAILIAEGTPHRQLFILEAGGAFVEVSHRDGSALRLAELKAGAMFGEMDFLEERPPVASVLAGPECRILRISQRSLELAMATNANLASDLYQLMARKLALQLQSQNALIHRWPGVSIEPLRKALVVFAYLAEADVSWLARHGRPLHLDADTVLIREGEPVPDLLILLAGSALVSMQIDGHQTIVGSSRRGEILGEMSLLGDANLATASVYADGPIDVLRLSKNLLTEQLEANPGMAARFYRAMAVLLSQRNRDQLQSHGLAVQSQNAEDNNSDDEDAIDFTQMSGITTAGLRFDWLCRNVNLGLQIPGVR